MGLEIEVLGVILADKAKLLPAAKRTEKKQKRLEHETKVQEAKIFFSDIDNRISTATTSEAKQDLILQCFKYLGPSLANIENLAADTTGEPFKE